MNHTDIINYLIKKRGYETYLEIGVQKPWNNFDKIDVPFKLGVDPATQASSVMPITSDKFFEHCSHIWDVIFIDGDHSYEQSLRDMWNAYQHVSCLGVIIVHDCNPVNEDMTGDKQIIRNHPWCGNTYRAWCEFRAEMEYHSYTLDADFGIGIVEMNLVPDNYKIEQISVDWKKFEANRKELLNLMLVDDFTKKEEADELRRNAKQAKG